jgi:hypothetical protein
MEIDHVFLRAKYNAPEAALFRAFGLTEGSGNRHPGQGTENRRFFFRNAFIELLWIADEDEIKTEQTQATMLYERLHDGSLNVSPFGVCFRPAAREESAPFPMWHYTPKYLPNGMTVGIGKDVPLSEPMWFFLAHASAPVDVPEERRQPLEHTAGLLQITSITITAPGSSEWSAPAKAAVEAGSVNVVEGCHHLMEITFDNGSSRQRHDFRPSLPLVFNY